MRSFTAKEYHIGSALNNFFPSTHAHRHPVTLQEKLIKVQYLKRSFSLGFINTGSLYPKSFLFQKI